MIRALAPLLAFWGGCGQALIGQTYSLDHRHRAELVLSVDGTAVRQDGNYVAQHEWVDPDTLRLSPAGTHLAYAAREETKWRVVLDGDPLPEQWDAVLPGSLRLDDRGRLVCAVRRGPGVLVLAGGRAEGPYDAIASLQADADLAHVAYIARRGDDAWAVVDGERRGPYQALAELLLGPRDGRVALIARGGPPGPAGGWRLLYGGHAEAHESAAGLHFSPGGARLGFVARDGGREQVRVIEGDGVWAGPAFPRVLWRTLQIDDAAAPLYVAEDGGQRFAVEGAAAGPPYDDVRGLARAGPRVAYIGRRGDREQVVIDGQPGPWWDEVGQLALGAEGPAYLARQGPALRLVTPAGSLALGWALAGSLALCARHVALLGGLPGSAVHQVIVDGTARRTFDAAEPEVTRSAWGAAGLRRWLLGELGPACDETSDPRSDEEAARQQRGR